MGIIDRYILRQFVQTFLICLFSLTGLYIVFGAFTNLDSFLEVAEEHGGLLGIVATYYGYQSLYFFDMTAGMLALISAMFTITWLQRHNEMTALMAAGVPRIRVAVPVIVAAASIAAIATVNRELIIPRYQNELVQKPTDLSGEAGRPLRSCYDEQTDILIRGDSTYAAEQRISEPSFLMPDGKQLLAENAYYRAAEKGRPGGYLLVGVEQPKDLATSASFYLNDKPVIITPRDAPWLKPDECFVASDATFELLTKELTFASTAELISGLHNPSADFGHQVRVDIHARMVRPFLDLTLLLLGLPLVMTRENRSVFIAIGLCILVVTVFVMATWTLLALGTNCIIPPHLAAWGPLLIFIPIAVAMAGSMWK